MYIILDKLYNNNFGSKNLFPNSNSAKGRAEQLNNEFPTNSFKVYELVEIK